MHYPIHFPNKVCLENFTNIFTKDILWLARNRKIYGFYYATQYDPQFNTLRPRQNGRHFADDTFKRIFLNENVRISIKISLRFVPKGPINNIAALVQIMAWRRPGDKPLSEPMMVSLKTHICVTRPQWVNFAIAALYATSCDNCINSMDK